MTNKLFIDSVKKLRAIDEKIAIADQALGTNFVEGAIGDLYSIIYDLLLPYEVDDETFEKFGQVLYTNDYVSDKEIENLYYEIWESD